MPCFAQVPVASEYNEPQAEEAQHCQGGEEGDYQAGDQGSLHMGHTSCYQVKGQNLQQEAEAGVGGHQHSQAAHYHELEEADSQPGQKQTPEP